MRPVVHLHADVSQALRAIHHNRRRMNIIFGYRHARYYHVRGFKRGDL